MTDSTWKTGAPKSRSERTMWPTPSQITRQLGLVVLIAVVWGGLFAGYLRLSGAQQVPIAAQRQSTPRSGTRLVVAQQPTNTPTAVPATSPTDSPTLPAPTFTVAVAAGETRPVPSPTQTPAPPTNTPTPKPATSTVSVPSPTAKPDTTGVSFAKNVFPILQRRCVKCHGGEKTGAGLVLKTFADILAGSENGPVITPGKSADSLLIEMISTGKMPKKEPPLLPAEIRTITLWVNAGAPNN